MKLLKTNSSDAARRSSAPALERGIAALSILCTGGAKSLEDLSKEMRISKSSLSRFMQTLQQMGLAGRDETTKKYFPRSCIIPLEDADLIFKRKIGDCLSQITRETGRTSEWFVPSPQGMVIADRREAENASVQVKAKIGFLRTLDNELEAVVRVALASGVPFPSACKYWRCGKNGKIRIPESSARNIVRKTMKSGYAMDEDYNANGIRRYAAPVKSADGRLVGIISLAEIYTPDSEKYSKKLIRELLITANKIEEERTLA